MKTNKLIYRLLLPAAIFFTVACVNEEKVRFGLDSSEMQVGPEGTVQTVNVSSAERWTAMADQPWITVSPANGNSSQECRVIVDSTLTVASRTGVVRINNLETEEYTEIKINQEGFDYQIVLDDSTVEIEDFANLDDRKFDVVVNTNVDFDVVLPEGAEKWLEFDKETLNLDRGARPRNVRIHFKWMVNSRAEERNAKVTFSPLPVKDETGNEIEVTTSRNDCLNVIQGAAIPIPENTVEGDSLALVAISRALNCWNLWDMSEKMEYWDEVEVWKSGPNKGRVRSARFYLFNTQEGIPYEVQYLTAAEDLSFYSNNNSFLKSLNPGEYITTLTQLKRLQIGAYGLTTLPESFKNLVNLEYLDLSSNNFQDFPDILTPENFPKLHALVMHANQRRMVYDLSNSTYDDFGGFYNECPLNPVTGKRSFPRYLLEWEQLDTLRLSVNYFQGEIPDMEDYHKKWTAEEVHASDTLPEILIGLPKVLPNTNYFAVNLNRLSGKLPDWLLYHPKLDLWFPYSLVFTQEGKDVDGNSAGFSNEPVNLDYYYAHYVNKVYNPENLKN